MDLVIWWRAGNAILALSAFVYLFLDLRAARKTLDRRQLYLTLSLAVLLLGAAANSIENIVQDNPVGFRTAFNTAASLWCLIGLRISRNERAAIWKEVHK